jgi:hypothetical protein
MGEQSRFKFIVKDKAIRYRTSVYSGKSINPGEECFRINATSGSITRKDLLQMLYDSAGKEYLNEKAIAEIMAEKI